MPKIESLFQKTLYIIIFITFLLLLYKNPFSERNLIPNLEPFPDTIHYLTPALSFLEGKGLVIERGDRKLIPAVPFLYSVSLIPGFFLNTDVRFFYFTNLIFAFLGLIFFYKFLEKLFKNTYINTLILFLYVTNYFIYWYPNLAMAENLILALYSLSLYMLVSRLTPKKAFFSGFVAISFYATKYASVTLTLTFFLLYSTKIFLDLIPKFKGGKNAFIIPLIFSLSIFIAFLTFFLIDSLTRGNNILLQLLDHFTPLIATQPSSENFVQSSSWFSFIYFNEHFWLYLNAIAGNPMRFLWDFTPLVPKYIALPALFGILLGIFLKETRLISFALLLFILIPTIAISPFYTADARYIYHVIPSLLAGFGLFLMVIYNFFKKNKLKRFFYVFLISLFIFYAANNFYRLKYQAVLNLKYAETPWYYISVKKTNEFFDKNIKAASQKPYLISALPPYFIDFYTNNQYILLPLSNEQEFRKRFNQVFGEDDYSDLFLLYGRKLKAGYSVYLSNSGLGNEGYLRETFKKIVDQFNAAQIYSGCFETCNIYKLKSP